MTIQANIPDFLIRQAADVAKREGTRAQRGNLSDLDDILAAVPDVPPTVGDEK